MANCNISFEVSGRGPTIPREGRVAEVSPDHPPAAESGDHEWARSLVAAELRDMRLGDMAATTMANWQGGGKDVIEQKLADIQTFFAHPAFIRWRERMEEAFLTGELAGFLVIARQQKGGGFMATPSSTGLIRKNERDTFEKLREMKLCGDFGRSITYRVRHGTCTRLLSMEAVFAIMSPKALPTSFQPQGRVIGMGPEAMKSHLSPSLFWLMEAAYLNQLEVEEDHRSYRGLVHAMI